VKDPLLAPLAAVALGIGLPHLVWFAELEARVRKVRGYHNPGS